MPIYNFPNTESNDTFPSDDYLNLILRYREIALTSDAEPILTVEECTTLFHMYFNTLFLLARETGNLLKSTNLTQEKLHQVFSGYAEGTYNTLVKYLDKVRKSKYYTILFDYLKVDSTEENAPGTMIYQYSIITNSKALKKSASRRIDRTEPIQPEDLVQTIRGEYHIPDNVKYIPDFVLSLLEWYDSAQQYSDTVKTGFRNDDVANVFLIQREISDTSIFDEEFYIGTANSLQTKGKKVRDNNNFVTYITTPELWNNNFSDPHVDKLYRYILREYDKSGSTTNNGVVVDTKDFAETIGVKPVEERKQILKTIDKMRTACFGKVTKTTYGVYNVIRGVEVERKAKGKAKGKPDLNHVKVIFDDEFKQYYLDAQEKRYFCTIPDCLFKLNNYDTEGNAYFIGVYMIEKHRKEQKNIYKGDNPEFRHKTQTLLRVASKITSYEALKDKGQFKQRIISPFIKSLETLVNISFLTGFRFVDKDGNDIKDPLAITWLEFISSYVIVKGNFPEYPELRKGLKAREDNIKISGTGGGNSKAITGPGMPSEQF